MKRRRIKSTFFRLLLGIIALTGATACNDDDNVSDEAQQAGLSMSISGNFDRHPERNLYNIQTGDTVLYDLNLKDAHYSSNAKYVFSLNSSSSNYHERLNYDYKAYLLSKEAFTSIAGNEKSKLSLDSLNMLKGDTATFNNLGKYVLIIVPKIPGTFRHQYYLKKYINNQAFVEAKENNFNVVKIKAWWVDNVIRSGSGGFMGIGSHASKHENNFFIQIEDGERETDNYLKPKSNFILDCEVNYGGEVYSIMDKFDLYEPMCFYKSGVSKKKAPDVKVKTITRLKVQKASKVNGNKGEVVFIEYWNIPIEERKQ